MAYFARFKNYLVTANADGSIPSNAEIVCVVSEVHDDLLAMLLAQANAQQAQASH